MEEITNRFYKPTNDWIFDIPGSFNEMIQKIINEQMEWAFIESEAVIISNHINDIESGHSDPAVTVYLGDETFARFDIPYQALVNDMIDQGTSELFEEMLKTSREKED